VIKFFEKIVFKLKIPLFQMLESAFGRSRKGNSLKIQRKTLLTKITVIVAETATLLQPM